MRDSCSAILSMLSLLLSVSAWNAQYSDVQTRKFTVFHSFLFFSFFNFSFFVHLIVFLCILCMIFLLCVSAMLCALTRFIRLILMRCPERNVSSRFFSQLFASFCWHRFKTNDLKTASFLFSSPELEPCKIVFSAVNWKWSWG